MLRSTPLVSVVIPTYNSRSLLMQALKSVRHQTFTDYEIVVVDDGSTDDTRSWIAENAKDVTYAYQVNRGQAVARNVGADLAKGRYIAFLDADDMWLPDKLATQVSQMQREPDAAFVFGDGYRYESEESSDMPVDLDCNLPLLSELYIRPPARLAFDFEFRAHCVPTSSLMVPRSLFQEIGGMPNVPPVEDYVTCCMLLLSSPEAIFVDEPLIFYRAHGKNTSSAIHGRKQALNRILAKDKARLHVWDYAKQLGYQPKSARNYARLPIPIRLLRLLMWRITYGSSNRKILRDLRRYIGA